MQNLWCRPPCGVLVWHRNGGCLLACRYSYKPLLSQAHSVLLAEPGCSRNDAIDRLVPRHRRRSSGPGPIIQNQLELALQSLQTKSDGIRLAWHFRQETSFIGLCIVFGWTATQLPKGMRNLLVKPCTASVAVTKKLQCSGVRK